MSAEDDLIEVGLQPARAEPVRDPRPIAARSRTRSAPPKEAAAARPPEHQLSVRRPDAASEADSASAAAPVASTTAPSPAVADGAVSDYSRVLLEHIEHYKRYPQMAGSERPNGIVRVLFKLARNGSVLGVWVEGSSGSMVLDREAVATLLRGQPLPPIPAGLPDPMDFSLDIDFSPPGAALSG
jgi:protein TonB